MEADSPCVFTVHSPWGGRGAGWIGLLSSVFGEFRAEVPKMEVRRLGKCCVSSVFGEWVGVSPMAEVWWGWVGLLTSVFGE